MPSLVKFKKDRKPIEVGCKKWNNCFTCPFGGCCSDIIKGKGVACELRYKGLKVEEIAQKLGKSKRTICRYLSDKILDK